jgi:phthalate 4,5-dioxygenase oxygenase subunit
MLSSDEHELLYRVGPGTPLGNLLRHYWVPVLESSELVSGYRAKRVRILGEDLVAFRTATGDVGLVGEFCPHRWASLYFGRIEETGIRCVYHGWQFALDGQCLDMPNEPAASDFKAKVCHAAYPCAERGGVIWAYMGPSSPSGLPDLEWALVPPEQRFVSKFYQHCSFLTALEGGVDPAHISFLHGVVAPEDAQSIEDFDRAAAGFGQSLRLERMPHLEVSETEYGCLIGARRQVEGEAYYWRITQYHIPFHTMPPVDLGADKLYHTHMWFPSDDDHLVNWCVSWHPTRPLTDAEREAMQSGLSIHITDFEPATNEAYGDIRPRGNRHNDYFLDWQLQHTRRFFGVPGVGLQDKAVTESQPPHFRTAERLGRADIGIIQVRKCLLEATLALRDHGTPPPGTDPASYRILPASLILPREVLWTAGAKEHLVSALGTEVPRPAGLSGRARPHAAQD